ncbi:hypothetical protein Y1Q_0012900 [Alligator mississippiensis]|uniref:Secreted protein n=1 Tax=Alligator mississippiensis TaxID=8496 RepID=A0A151MTF2_ALLMI|nr:hypothetical protein Y1Q_0012900 [Alligator mississippiensis]
MRMEAPLRLVALVPALCLGMDHTSCRCLQLLCRLKGSSVEAGLWLCSWRQDPWSPAVVLGGNIAAGFCPG